MATLYENVVDAKSKALLQKIKNTGNIEDYRKSISMLYKIQSAFNSTRASSVQIYQRIFSEAETSSEVDKILNELNRKLNETANKFKRLSSDMLKSVLKDMEIGIVLKNITEHSRKLQKEIIAEFTKSGGKRKKRLKKKRSRKKRSRKKRS